MNELFNRIIAWHEKNLPTGLPYEPLPQIGFLIEELGEVNKEFIKGDIDKAVGEITDLIVFSVNAIQLLKIELVRVGWFNLYKDKNTPYVNIIFYLHDKIGGIIGGDYRFYNHLIDECCTAINSLGYNPELTLLETVKKIESRRGAFNTESGKWEKEKNQTDVYKPDYFKAKIKKHEKKQ